MMQHATIDERINERIPAPDVSDLAKEITYLRNFYAGMTDFEILDLFAVLGPKFASHLLKLKKGINSFLVD